MHEWGLLALFMVLGLIAIGVALIPLRQSKRLMLTLFPVLVLGLVLAYGMWGSWPAWRAFHVTQTKQKQAEALVRSLGSTQALIERFQSHLKQAPNDAKGWFLLGRVYVAEADWVHAQEAFTTAHVLDPNDDEFTLHYVQSVWELNHHVFDEGSRGLLLAIFKKNSHQPDALAMLAFDAYTRHDDETAVMYWERLLTLAPSVSEEAEKLRQAIAKARMRMI